MLVFEKQNPAALSGAGLNNKFAELNCWRDLYVSNARAFLL